MSRPFAHVLWSISTGRLRARIFLAMDVRCDRCQTEYELDDDSVSSSGASVQCTTCGHTFVVSPNGSIVVGTTPPGGLPGGSEPAAFGSRASSSGMPAGGLGGLPSTGAAPQAAPEWVLATEEGQTHRLRDLTTLQKWVVERRVGRGDRVSHRGGPWRMLGDVEELRPFLDIVAEADRHAAGSRPPVSAPSPGARTSEVSREGAREASRDVRPTRPATPRNVPNAARAHVSPDLDDDDVLSRASSQARRGRQDLRGPDPFLSTDIGTDDDLSLSIRPKRTGLKVMGALAFVAAAAGAWYVGFRDPHGFRIASGTPVPPATAPAAAPPAAAPPVAPAAAPPAAAPPAVAPPPAAVAAGSAGAAAAPAPAAAPVAALPAEAPKPPPAPEAAAPPAPEPAKPVAAAAPEAPKAAAAPSPPAADNKPKSYERLVADADHALENGQTAKAQKLYDEALRLQPNGVAATTGAAYVLMDKRRPLAAIGLFKQALSGSPHYAPALFGLGEAYRTQGDSAQAIEAYKNYLEQSPTGTDAPAARRQIKDLSEAAPARNQGPSAVVPENARVE
jgi:predicted Zn finger-like uncharacterized protein